jgi:hypothetical protein
LVEKPEKRRSVGRFSCKRKHNIKMHHQEVWWEGVDCIYVTEDRIYCNVFPNTVKNFRFLCGRYLTVWLTSNLQGLWDLNLVMLTSVEHDGSRRKVKLRNGWESIYFGGGIREAKSITVLEGT